MSNSSEFSRIMTLLHTLSSVVSALMSVTAVMKMTLLENRNNHQNRSNNNQNHHTQLQPQPSLKPVVTLSFDELAVVQVASEQLAELSNKISTNFRHQSILLQSTQADAVVLSANIVCDMVGLIALASDPLVDESFEV